VSTNGANSYGSFSLFYETSNITASTTFNVFGGASGGTLNVNGLTGGGAALGGTGDSTIEVDEIMGALEPANDNQSLRMAA